VYYTTTSQTSQKKKKKATKEIVEGVLQMAADEVEEKYKQSILNVKDKITF